MVGRWIAVVRSSDRVQALGAISGGWFLILGLRFTFPTLLPQFTQAFSLNNSTAGLVITVVWAGYALMQFPAGFLDDRTGERSLLVVSLVLAAASMGLVGVAPVLSVFLVGCAALGLGSGLYGPSRGTAASNLFPDHDDTAFSAMLAAGSIGSALLPVLAGRAVGKIGWRLTLGLSLPPLLLVAGAVWWTVPSRMTDPTPTDRSELGDAITDRSVLVATAAITVMIFTFQGLTAFLPTYLISEKGLSQGTAAVLFAIVFVSGAGFQFAAGPLAERHGERRVLVAVATVGILTVGAFPFVDGIVALGALVAVLGSRMAAAPITNAYIVGMLPDAEEGTAWGLLRTVMFLVSATGSLFVGTLSDAGWFDGAFLALAAITASAVGLYAMLPDRE